MPDIRHEDRQIVNNLPVFMPDRSLGEGELGRLQWLTCAQFGVDGLGSANVASGQFVED
jgi:hypothetical protein